MATSSGSVFSETLQTITTTKLEELAKQRIAFEEEYAALKSLAEAEKDPLKRVLLLVDGTKSCLGIKTSGKKSKDGQSGRVVNGGTGNARLETDLKNLDRFLEQARFDPSVSAKVLDDWEKTLLQYLSVQSTKYQYADLYGKLVTEWLSSEKGTPVDGNVEMTESFEELPGAKKLAARAEWEKNVFEPANVDVQALKAYLDELFITNKKDASIAIRELRNKVAEFENSLSGPSQFSVSTLRWVIGGLQHSDLLSNEKREALKDFLSNDVILTEIADILNVRMSALDRWNWGEHVPLEQRRKLNGSWSIHMDSDVLQAIFLHYIGTKWSVFFKTRFLAILDHNAWLGSNTEVPKIDRLRRSYFLGDRGTQTTPSLQDKRIKTHRNRYFAYQLVDHDTQSVEMEEGEEEAEYGDYVDTSRKRQRPMYNAASSYAPPPPPPQQQQQMMMQQAMMQQAPMQQAQSYSMHAPRQARAKQTARRSVHQMQAGPGTYADEDDNSEEDSDDTEYYKKTKRPMDAKQGLLHLVSTEIIVNTRLYKELTCFRTVFDSWNPLLPHESVLSILEFLGVSGKWSKFFQKFLQAPLKFTDDQSSEPRLRRRGTPGSHALSDMLGEVVLFCLDFGVNQATDGALLHRLYDDVWFFNKDYEKCVNAWASVLKFTAATGVKLDEKKTGSVRIAREGDAAIDDRLPDGEIRWGFLSLKATNGRFEIDQKMVDGHVEELRKQLQGKSTSVIDYIQAWNSYAATFFSSNFGKASNCFGREHVDKMLATHRHIQESIFPGGNIVQHLKEMIKERFSVSSVPDGFLFFPVELGGLDLKSPFVGLLQIRESVKENPYDLLDEYEENERDDYAAAKRTFDRGIVRDMRYNVEDPSWRPGDAETFFSFAEFIAYRENLTNIGKAKLRSTYAKLLERPKEEPVELGVQVGKALDQLRGQNNLRGITCNWSNMNAYWKWIAQMYGPEMTEKFGGLNVVDFGLLPIGMVSMFRQRRTKWQG
ncbi:Nn.00g016320.m01.CDS01 [Neocucurbitaria sp. VM-36]